MFSPRYYNMFVIIANACVSVVVNMKIWSKPHKLNVLHVHYCNDTICMHCSIDQQQTCIAIWSAAVVSSLSCAKPCDTNRCSKAYALVGMICA